MINVSIVLYRTPFAEVKALVDTLRINSNVKNIWLIDNSEIITEAFMFLPVTYIFNNKNIGYGAAHNIAIRKSFESSCKYHIVLNSDIEVKPETITIMMNYMDNSPETGLIMPKVFSPDGTIQHLCKLLPSPKDLIFRRFIPETFNKNSNARYELHSFSYDKIINIPYLSGCFMFLRLNSLRDIGIFDERFFMYPEDIDLSRRLHRKYKTEFFPEVSIIHHHGKASYRNKKMLWIHIINMCKYFNKWGWLFDKERKQINKKTEKLIPHS